MLTKCEQCGRPVPAYAVWTHGERKICQECARGVIKASMAAPLPEQLGNYDKANPTRTHYNSATECPDFDGKKCGCGNNGGGDCDYCLEVLWWTNHPEERGGVSMEQFSLDCHAYAFQPGRAKFELEPSQPQAEPAREEREYMRPILALGFLLYLLMMAWANCHPVQRQDVPTGEPPALYIEAEP